jgi:hypothetical protein
MDELELITRFRADTPEPDADSVARAHAVLLNAMEQTSRRVDRNPHGSRRRRWSRVAVVVVGAVVMAVAVPVLLPDGSGRNQAAAAALREAAVVARHQPVLQVGEGQFVYTRSENAYQGCIVGVDPPPTAIGPGDGDMSCTLERFTREIWIAPDGSGRLREQGDRTGDEAFGPGGLSFEDLSTLPTGADALRDYVERRAEGSDKPVDVQMFTIVADLLRETHATPELRAALYEVAATLPGTELIGETSDELGRPGIGVGYTYLGVRHELIFDPATSAILGERQVQVDPPVSDASPAPEVGVNADGVSDPGTVLGWSSVTASGVVDSTEERVRSSSGS